MEHEMEDMEPPKLGLAMGWGGEKGESEKSKSRVQPQRGMGFVLTASWSG